MYAIASKYHQKKDVSMYIHVIFCINSVRIGFDTIMINQINKS